MRKLSEVGMSQRLLLGTRKGLFLLSRKQPRGRFEIEHVAFVGSNVSMVLPDWRDESVYAALNLGHFGVKLHRSADGGRTWKACAEPAYPKVEGADAAEPAPGGVGTDKKGDSLELIWSLEAAEPGKAGTLWCGTIPGGLFRSDDAGESWQLNKPLWDNPKRKEWVGGGMDRPGIHSICVHPKDANHVIVGVSCGGVWETRDAGKSWNCRASGMQATYMPPDRRGDPNLQDAHRVVQSPTDPKVLWAQHHDTIYHTIDGCESWHEVKAKPSSFGFAVVVHPRDPQTAWFVPAVKDECRVPVDAKVSVARTRDGGKTFDVLTRGLPQQNAYHIVYRHSLDVDASGQSLAFGSTTGSVWTSDDGGDGWECLSTDLPPIYCVRFAAGA
jgi:hypothetical protein